MAEQETLMDGADDPAPGIVNTWDPHDHGTWRRFQSGEDGVFLDDAAINRARAEHGFVGTCRECGGHLVVARGRNHDGAEIQWTDLECIDCRKETAAPNGKVLRRDSRHHHMPNGWWARRIAALKTGKTAF